MNSEMPIRQTCAAVPPSGAQVFMDGRYVPWEEASIHIRSNSVQYGTGIFEGIRARATDDGSCIFRLTDHIARMVRSASIVGMELPLTSEQIRQAIIGSVIANNVPAGYGCASANILSAKDIKNNGNSYCAQYIRPFAFYGADRPGLRTEGATTHFSVMTWPWGSYLEGGRLKTSNFRALHPLCGAPHAKLSGNYGATSCLAVKEISGTTYNEVLRLDYRGYICEGSGENIFIISKDRGAPCLITPRAFIDVDGESRPMLLEGITRDTIMKLAPMFGLGPVIEADLTPDELLHSNEAFMTGTACGIAPIEQLDGQLIGAPSHRGSIGPITAQLQEAYRKIVHGIDSRFSNWCTLLPGDLFAQGAL